MSLPDFLTEFTSPAFIQSADNSVKLFTDDDTDANDAAKKLAKRKLRVSFCMVGMQVSDPVHGGVKWVQRPCGEKWLCDRCHEWHVNKFRERITRMAESGEVRWVSADDEEAAQLARKYGKDNYHRIPLNSDYFYKNCDENLIFIHTDEPIGQPLDLDRFEVEFGYENLFDVPKGRHLSGKLGSGPIVSEDKLPSVQHTAVVVEGLSESQKNECGHLAVESTPQLDPHTLDELTEAMETRIRAYVKEVYRMGGKVVFSRSFRTAVDLGVIQWKITTPDSIGSIESPLHSHKSRPRRHLARNGYQKSVT